MIFFNSTENVVFSNFLYHPLTIAIDGDRYTFTSAEAAFQALKEKPYRPDHITAFTTMTPTQARAAGRRSQLRPDWHDVRVPLMAHILKAKFLPHPDLLLALRDTGQHELIHRAPWDAFWGDGKDKTGHNMLGKLLMDIRANLPS